MLNSRQAQIGKSKAKITGNFNTFKGIPSFLLIGNTNSAAAKIYPEMNFN